LQDPDKYDPNEWDPDQPINLNCEVGFDEDERDSCEYPLFDVVEITAGSPARAVACSYHLAKWIEAQVSGSAMASRSYTVILLNAEPPIA
jgi:hypothetical protein